jgi:hypothetical protein
LTLSLTHLLIRTRSFQDFWESTTSRASIGRVSHSRGVSWQNSIQPIGARALAPTAMYKGRSFAASASAAGSMAAAASAAAIASPAPNSLVQLKCIL